MKSHFQIRGVRSSLGWSNHYLMVDGDKLTYTREEDSSLTTQSGATSIVLQLEAGQQISVVPYKSYTITSMNEGGWMYSWFEATLMHAGILNGIT